MRVGDLLEALLDLVLPQACAGCGQAGTRWCPACAAALAAAASAPLGSWAPDPVPAGFPRAAAAAPYAGSVRGALLAHKERGQLGLVRPLGAALAAAVRLLAPPPGLVLVPVPSDRRVVRARGHDHARRLAGRAAGELRRTGLPVQMASLLVQVRVVSDQAGLSASGRRANLAGAMRARTSLTGLVVVVVDDVVTTGTSLAEAARALAAAGAQVHGAATVAATARRGQKLSVRSAGGPPTFPGPTGPVQPTSRGLPSGAGTVPVPYGAQPGGQEEGTLRPPPRAAAPHRNPEHEGDLRGHRRQGPQRRSAAALPGARSGEAGSL